MAKKKRHDPHSQALVDPAPAGGNPTAFSRELRQQISEMITDINSRRNPEIDLPDRPLHPTLVTARIDLVGAHPPIWRRLELRGDLSLADVHEYLQAAFGWLSEALHRFDAPHSLRRSAPCFITKIDAEEGGTGTDERDVRLDQVLRKPGEKLHYTYDSGDAWEHVFTVEAVGPASDDDPPARCTDGGGACPPEDVGGIHTWNELAAALRADPDPAHLTGELEMYAEWLPAGCGPDDFSRDEANTSISLVGVDPDQLLGQSAGPRDAARASPLLGHLDVAPSSLLLGHDCSS